MTYLEMFKSSKTKKKIWILGGLLIVVSILIIQRKEVFATLQNLSDAILHNPFQTLLNKVEGNAPIDKIFNGNASAVDIYRKSLEIVKTNETSPAKTSIEQINIMINKESITINPYAEAGTENHIFNVLYDSNSSIRNVMEEVLGGKIPEEKINESYNYMIMTGGLGKSKECAGKSTTTDGKITKVQRDCVKKYLLNNYQLLLNNNYTFQSFNQESFGEDIFMNGSLDDSEYDLVTDIQNIGKILFESFKPPVEAIFYAYPKFPQGSSNNGTTALDDFGNGGGTLSDAQIEDITNKANAINSGRNSTVGNQTTNPQTGNKTNSGNTNTNVPISGLDQGTQQFLNQFNQAPSTQGNPCITGLPNQLPNTAESPTYTAAQVSQMIVNFLSGSQPGKENGGLNNQVPKGSSDYSGLNLTGATINERNEQLANILLSSNDVQEAASCMNKCKDLPYDQKLLCETQCVCFMVTYPKYDLPEMIDSNEMLKLRFCTIPVQQNRISRGKTINSLDEMMGRIRDVLDNLINGGEMVKYKKTKEFLDNPIADLKFDKIFSFEIKVDFKPLFNNQNPKAEKIKAQNKTNMYRYGIENKSADIGINPNKYMIIADPITNKVSKEYSDGRSDREIKKTEEITDNKLLNQVILENPIKTIINNKTAVVNDTIDQFLDGNVDFRMKIALILGDINEITATLKESLK